MCPTGKNHCDHKSSKFELLYEKVPLRAMEVYHGVYSSRHFIASLLFRQLTSE